MDLLVILGIILIIGWALGMFAFHVVGWYIHILLIAAIVLIVVRLLGRASRA